MQPIRILAPAWALVCAGMIVHPIYSRAQTTTPPPLAPRPSTPAPAQPATTPPKPAAPAAKPATPGPAAKPAAPAPAAKPAAPATAKPAPAKPAAASEQPKLLGQYGEWGAYTASPGGKKICFALAKPGSSQTNPANRPREPAYLFISTRPAEKVKEEVSTIIGYTFKPNSETTAAIGPTTFSMYTQEDGAWVKNAADESKMVEAMRKGADLVVKGESNRGTKTTDTFSLKGLAQALDKVAQECK